MMAVFFFCGGVKQEWQAMGASECKEVRQSENRNSG